MMFDSHFGATIPYGIGLGQEPAPSIEMQALDHSLVPFRSRPRFLRLVKSLDHARDYAAGGFHVSVTRGLCGGAGDSAIGFAESGTVPGACQIPLDRADLRLAWANTARAYFDAFIASRDEPLDAVKDRLRAANALADQAYALEGVEPPRDPQTGTPEPPSPKGGISDFALAGLGFVLAGGLTYVYFKYGRMPKGRRR